MKNLLNRFLSFQNRIAKRAILVSAVAVLAIPSSAALVGAISCSTRSECDAKISNLNNANQDSQSKISSLQVKSLDFQSQIGDLNNQIAGLVSKINANTEEQARLQDAIAKNKIEIAKDKQSLGDTIRSMYIDGNITSIEMLATSRNLSDYVDRQEYKNVIQNKIQSELSRINDLQNELTSQEQQVAKVLSSLSSDKDNLSTAKSNLNYLLAMNKQQQADYNASIQANNSQLEQLRILRQQAINSISGSGGVSRVGSPIKYKNFWTGYSTCGGGYGYCWAGFDQRVYNDDWGSGLAHECVNFVSDWLSRNGFQGPNRPGNAENWPSYGQHISSVNVEYGDVAYMPLPGVGHVGVVTHVNDDGTFHISQMNWPTPGYYSEMDLYPQNITFIRFPHK